MNQAWDSLLSKTLRIVSDDHTDKSSILLAINQSYSETTTGPITRAQREFDKLFVKIVCTAFSVCTTEPTKNFPRFESQKKSKTFNGRNLQTLNQELYREIQKEIQCQMDDESCDDFWEYSIQEGMQFPYIKKMWPRKKYNYDHYMQKL